MALRMIARTLRTTALVGSLAFAVGGAPASAQNFSSVVAFGDSYADTGNLFKITGVNPATTIYPTGRFSGGTNFVDTLSSLLYAPQVNFAIGGATTGSTNVVGPGIPGFTQEYTGFVKAGGFFLPTDVVALSIGGNDARAYQLGGGSLAGAPVSASVSTTQAIAGINSLVGVGARTIVFTAGDAGQLPEIAASPAGAAVRTAFSQTYNSQMMNYLAGLAAAGVRIEYVDLQLISAAIAANPGLTGITGVVCPATCVGNAALQAKYLFYVDGLHLTSNAFAVVGEYIANRLNAPLTFSAQGQLGQSSTLGFIQTMFSRLDLFGAEAGPTIVPAPLAYAEGRVTKGPLAAIPVVPPPSPFSIYVLVNGAGGTRQQSSTRAGYDYDSFGGTVGAEYRFGREGIIGGAFQYSNPYGRFYNGIGTTEVKSYQFGLYGAWTRANFFAQALVGGGFQDYTNTRAGVLLGNLLAKPSGTSLAAAGKIGYLFNTGFSLFTGGLSRIGPIVGLTYASNRINAATESGDAALALALGQQNLRALTGSAGVQFRSEFPFFGNTFETFTNITAEDDFQGSGRQIQYSAVSSPIIVNSYAVPTRQQGVYGRTSGGFSAGLGYGVSASVTTFSTFGRRGGNDYGGQGGLKYAF